MESHESKSHESKSREADSDIARLEDEGERVERQIEQTKSDWKSKQGQVPGMEESDAPGPDDAEGEPEDDGESDGPARDTRAAP